MNKILVDGDKYFLSEDIKSIAVEGNATIYINDLADFSLNIKLLDNSSLSIYDFTRKCGNKEIEVTHTNNTKLSYFHTFKVSDKYNFKYKAFFNGNNNIDDINVSGVSHGLVNLDIDGVVIDNIKNNVLNENIKVLTIGGKCITSPMLHINTKEVIANHNTAISNIRDDELFYLKSKGIDVNSAIKLIEDGYIYGYFKKFDEEFYNLIKE
ncbi:MAG: SufD family Fe-S cluster assembly protein [Erysipelotrichales bacterium]|nr:SufD family Fe-S cluster assembly protein [Erysipelotrichales bacterium]